MTAGRPVSGVSTAPGAHVATAGAAVPLLATDLDWVSTDEGASASGYEADTVIPPVASQGVGLAVALLRATSRACGRRHRGLPLTAMAGGIVAVLPALGHLVDAPDAFEPPRAPTAWASAPHRRAGSTDAAARALSSGGCALSASGRSAGGGVHWAVQPPSMASAAPVMKVDSPERR